MLGLDIAADAVADPVADADFAKKVSADASFYQADAAYEAKRTQVPLMSKTHAPIRKKITDVEKKYYSPPTEKSLKRKCWAYLHGLMIQISPIPPVFVLLLVVCEG